MLPIRVVDIRTSCHLWYVVAISFCHTSLTSPLSCRFTGCAVLRNCNTVWNGSAHGTNTCETALWSYRKASYQCQPASVHHTCLLCEILTVREEGVGNVAGRRMDGCTELLLNVPESFPVCFMLAVSVFSTEIQTHTSSAEITKYQ